MLSVMSVLWASGAAACNFVPQQQNGEAMDLFVEVTDAAGLLPPSDRGLLRWRAVSVNFGVLSPDGASPGDVAEIALNLFDDVRLTAVRDRVEPAPSGNGVAWIGHVDGGLPGSVTFIITSDTLTGEIRAGNALYRVRPTAGGLHIISEIDPRSFGPD
ncbi:MAG: hypothetical protein HYX51_08355 [Chloroflexi bacterium]|nr:hypothetical protein [Chloroflexota bacterium]